MSKAIVNALTLALLDGGIGNTDINVATAREFAERFVEENAELFQQAAPAPSAVRPPTPQRPATAADLSEAQAAALEAGIGLCPNCQQPNNDHLPACSRATGYDGKAITKNKLNPVA